MSIKEIRAALAEDRYNLTQQEAYDLLSNASKELGQLQQLQAEYQMSFRRMHFLFFELYESITLKKDYVDAWGMLCEINKSMDIFGTNVLPIVCKALAAI